jgi:biotin synthase
MDSFILAMEKKVLSGFSISFEEAEMLSQTKDAEALYSAANQIREQLNGSKADLCSIMNAKSGACSENCRYCAQSAHYQTGVKEYPLVNRKEVLKLALENESAGVKRFSLITSGNTLSPEDFEQIISIYQELRKKTKLDLCASLGKLSFEQSVLLKNKGITMYHHNIETSRNFYPKICTTHSYEDRIQSIQNIQKAGLPVCSGGIIGMGETMRDRLEMAFELKHLGIKSIPINILTPIPGTPLEKQPSLSPEEVFRTIAVFRFIHPTAFIRYAGGRKALGSEQSKGYRAGINAALVGNFLTTAGNTIAEDKRLISEQGLEVQ